MVYLPPSVVLGRLSEFAADTIVGAIGDGSKFERAQAGSMASTLDFLARETEHRDGAILEQREAVLAALDELESHGDGSVTSFVKEQRTVVESVEPTIGSADEVESILLEVIGNLQMALDDGTFGDDTEQARATLYDLFETRIESQLRVLGRDA